MKLSKSVFAVVLALLMVLAPVMQSLHIDAAAAYEVGTMSAGSNGWGAGGIYATHNSSDAPYNTDWSLEYTQTGTDSSTATQWSTACPSTAILCWHRLRMPSCVLCW